MATTGLIFGLHRGVGRRFHQFSELGT